jgi:hypothetical protein
MRVKRHTPGFVEIASSPKDDVYVQNIEEMFALPYVKRWSDNPGFDCWERSDHLGAGTLLMAQCKDGRYWVVAYVEGGDLSSLPELEISKKGRTMSTSIEEAEEMTPADLDAIRRTSKTPLNHPTDCRPMTRIRIHRGSLADSMETVRVVNGSKEDLFAIIQKSLEPFGREITSDMLTVTPYHYDSRIGWDTHLITIEGYGVWGMADGPLLDSSVV